LTSPFPWCSLARGGNFFSKTSRYERQTEKVFKKDKNKSKGYGKTPHRFHRSKKV